MPSPELLQKIIEMAEWYARRDEFFPERMSLAKQLLNDPEFQRLVGGAE